MDLPQLLFHSLLLCFLFLLFKSFTHNRSKNPKLLLPPGPWKLPIIGSIHHLVGDLPHRRLHRLAATYGPLLHLKLGEIHYVVASTSAAAHEILKTHDLAFASRPAIMAIKTIAYDCAGMGFSPYGPYWRQLRKICAMEVLSNKRVKSYVPIRRDEAAKAVGEIRRRGLGSSPVNMTEVFLGLTNNHLTRAAFGKECRSRERFLRAMKETIKLAPVLSLVDLFPSAAAVISMFDGKLKRMRKLHGEMDTILNEIIEEHRSERRVGDHNSDHKEEEEEEEEDLLDVLMRVQESGELEIPLKMLHIKAVILETAATEQHQRPVQMEAGQSSSGAQMTGSPATEPSPQHGAPPAPNVVPPPPAPTPFQQTELGQTLTAILETFRAHQAPAPQQNPGANWLSIFRGLSPPAYIGTETAVRTEEWVDIMQEMLSGIQCPVEMEVPLVVSCLESHAKRWWKRFLATSYPGLEAADVAWDDFKAALLEHFVPQSARDDLEDRFLQLRQGSRSVLEYHQEFTHLSRFAVSYQLDDAGYAKRFYKGLRDELRQALLFVSDGSMTKILEMAKKLEGDQQVVRGRKRPMEDQGRSGRRDQPRGRDSGEGRTEVRPRQGERQEQREPVVLTPQPLQMREMPRIGGGGQPPECYHCHQVGHIKRNCPQRNALPAPQAAPRGQHLGGRGRGRGRGFQGDDRRQYREQAYALDLARPRDPARVIAGDRGDGAAPEAGANGGGAV